MHTDMSHSVAMVRPLVIGLFMVVALLVGLVMGFYLGPAGTPNPESNRERHRDGQAFTIEQPGPGPVSHPRGADCAQCEHELRLAQEAITELENELYGQPVAWDVAYPEYSREPEVRSRAARAVAECAPDSRLLGVDCAEPPCLVLLDTTHELDASKLLTDCPVWNEVWGRNIGQRTRRVDCEDGQTRFFAAISPGLLPEDIPNGVDWENVSKRVGFRVLNEQQRVCFEE